MKLYYSPGACSLSPHIALREAELELTLVRVDLGTKRAADGEDLQNINAKGYVPVLESPDGERLTEGPAILEYIADLAPPGRLAPPPGTLERHRWREWLGFITSELHKGFGPFFAADTPAEYVAIARRRLLGRLRWVDAALSARPYLLGERFSAADGYLFTVLRWSGHAGIELALLDHLAAFEARVATRAAVQAALRAEELDAWRG